MEPFLNGLQKEEKNKKDKSREEYVKNMYDHMMELNLDEEFYDAKREEMREKYCKEIAVYQSNWKREQEEREEQEKKKQDDNNIRKRKSRSSEDQIFCEHGIPTPVEDYALKCMGEPVKDHRCNALFHEACAVIDDDTGMSYCSQSCMNS